MHLRHCPRKRQQGAACGEFPLRVPSGGCHNNRFHRCLDDLFTLLAGHTCPAAAQKRPSPDQNGDLAAEDGSTDAVAKPKRGRPSMANSIEKVSDHLESPPRAMNGELH